MLDTRLSTSCGPIRGIVRDGIRIFRGIDYARCERFRPAERIDSWDGEYDATDYGTVAPQLSCRLASVIGAEKGAVVDEHRLCLSIYSPEGAENLPVMVWIHGGAFLTGGSEERRYSGERLVKAGNVVVVKISYRLGALGYLWMPEKGVGNLGLEDQRTALEWIHDHISDFGGDPARITVFGQSAGAHSVAALIASSKGRLSFQRAILQSPPLGMYISQKKAERIKRKFLRLLEEDPFTASVDKILEVQASMSSKSLVPLFQPVLDDVTGIPSELESDKLKIVCGYTAQDASPFLRKVLGPLFATGVGRAVVNYATKSVFASAIDQYVEKLRKHGFDARTYFISWAPKGNPLGSCHCIEMPFLLGFYEDWTEAAMLQKTTREEYERLSGIFLKAWTGFADGDNFTELKKAVRKTMKELRESTTDSQAEESRAIASKVMKLPQWQAADTVLLYSSLKGEVDTSLLLEAGCSSKRIVLPVVVGDKLVLREYRPESLTSGYQGIMEPSEDCPVVDPSEVQLALIPGVAFDQWYHRLGRGKGFYDRLLPLLDCPKIGMGFSWQMIDTVPVESHDIVLSGVITPERCYLPKIV